MSFVVAIKGPEGIVLASESRAITFELGKEYWTYDGFPKLFNLPAPHTGVGVLLAGEWPRVFGPVHVVIAERAARLPARRLPIAEYAVALAEVFAPARSPVPFAPIVLVAGYDEDGSGHVFQITGDPEPIEQHVGTVGLMYGGMRDAADRVLQGIDSEVLDRLRVQGVDEMTATRPLPLALATMPLDETVDLARFLIDLTVGALRFGGGYAFQGTGGPVEIATVTAEGFRWVQRRPEVENTVTHRERAAVPLAVALDTPGDINLPSTYTVDNGVTVAVE